MIKTVLFDLDDTIFDFKKAEAVAVSKALTHFGITPTDDIVKLYSEINKSQWLLLEQHKITRNELLTRRFDLLFEQLGVTCSSNEMQKVYEKLLGTGHYFMPYANEVLEQLHSIYDLYIVSNGTASVQKGRIDSSKISKYFKDIFISQLIGFNKPQKEFFECCFAKIPNFNKKNTIIVGDSLSSDIKGGNNAEILTCFYNPNHLPIPNDIIVNYEIANLKQLPNLLKSI